MDKPQPSPSITDEHRSLGKVQSSGWRVMLAFALAPASPVILFPVVSALRGTALDPVIWTFVPWMIAVGAYLPTVVLGIPTYAVLSRMMRLSPFNCMLSGAIIAAVPWFVIFAFVGPDQSYFEGELMRVGGLPTVAGWLQLSAIFGQIAVYGAFGGLVFWAIAAASLKPNR